VGGHAARSFWEGTGLMLLFGGLFLAPTAWFLDLQTSYALVKWACRHSSRSVLLLTAAGNLSLIALGSWMSWSCYARLRDMANEEGARMEDRSYFVAVAGLGVNATFALLVLTTAVFRLISPCE
jgi:hypothetical protein